MTHAGCYGVKIFGVDKIAFSGKDSTIPKLGMKIIKEINKTIKKMGYDEAIRVWRIQARDLIMTKNGADCQLKQKTIQDILSNGKAYDGYTSILDSYICCYGYILNLDEERFEIYLGNQLKYHNRGRFSKNGFFGERRYKACALYADIPLRDMASFDPYKFLLPDDVID